MIIGVVYASYQLLLKSLPKLFRIKDHLYSTIDREQAGPSCVHHINTLRLIIEQSAEYRPDLHLVFVDFDKPFYSVNRERIWVALRRRIYPKNLCHLVYNGAKCRVLHAGKIN